MASNDDLEIPFDTNSFLFPDLPETFSHVTECQPSFLASENEHNEIVGFDDHVVSAATNDVYPSPLIDNLSNDQETLTRNSRFDQEIVTQNQIFHNEDEYSRSFNPLQISPNVSSYTMLNGQRESVYSENCLLTSTNKAMMSSTAGLQPVGLQHGYVNRSFQQSLMSQTNHVSTMTQMGGHVQQVERTTGLTNFNPGLHPSRGSRFQEQNDLDLLLEQLSHIPENDQMQLPELSNCPVPPYVEALQSNQHQIPYVSSSANTIPNQEYPTPMISNTQILQTPANYPPFAHTPYQSDPLASNFQSSSTTKTTRRPRGRPRKNPTPVPVTPTTQTLLTSPRPYSRQNKGKQLVTTMPSSNSSLYNQFQNSYTNTMMIQQSGVLRQRSIYDQLENERPSSKTRRTMLPSQEKSIADSSTVSFWQDGNLRSSAASSNHEERSTIQNTLYDPLYAGLGLPIDPHLRFL